MKIKQVISLSLFIASISAISLHGCPITITNDSETPIIATDNYYQAVYIEPGNAMLINTAKEFKSGWRQALFKARILKENLIIYVQVEPGRFLKKYQLAEKYCTDADEKNNFKFENDFVNQSEMAKERYSYTIFEKSDE